MDAYVELKEAFEVREHLITALRDEIARLKDQLANAPAVVGATTTIPKELEATIVEYSFGSPQTASETRTWALRALAAKTPVEDIIAQIEKGREWNA